MNGAEMTNTKSFASLGPMLLARKGAAKPAMRPQLGPIATANSSENGDDLASAQDLLGWNDMGEDEDLPQPAETNVAMLSPFEPQDDMSDEGEGEEDEADLPPLDWQPEDEDDEGDVPFPVEPPAIHHQQAELAARFAAPPEPVASAAPAPETLQAPVQAPTMHVPPAVVRRVADQAAKSGRRAAFTLRLDAERHLKLRLASTIAGESAQKLVTQALDRLLGEMPEIDQLAARVKRG